MDKEEVKKIVKDLKRSRTDKKQVFIIDFMDDANHYSDDEYYIIIKDNLAVSVQKSTSTVEFSKGFREEYSKLLPRPNHWFATDFTFFSNFFASINYIDDRINFRVDGKPIEFFKELIER